MKRQGFPIEGSTVSYYSSIFSAFVNCSTDPVGDFVHISEKDLEIIGEQPSLRIRFEKSQSKMYPDSDDDFGQVDHVAGDLEPQEAQVEYSQNDKRSESEKQGGSSMIH